MPWRGPAYPGEFPSLGHLNGDWIEQHCVVPDRAVAGDALQLSDEQLTHLVWQYRLKPAATFHTDRPAAPFAYVGSVLIRAQKWGKGPFSACRICTQAVGPALFAGWARGGEVWDCRDYGCGCGWVYEYDPGEPMGMPWATPHIQVAAVSEKQTDNIWRALKPMIELGPLASVIPDTGLDRINLPGGGLIEPVTSKSNTRLGARSTYVELDQPDLMTARNGGVRLADVMRRNTAGTGGRWSATGNAYDPSERSVEQTDVEIPDPEVYVDFPESPPGSWENKRERRKILQVAYRGAPWVDVDRIESECRRLAAKGEASEAERFYGNRIVSGADKAFDVAMLWAPLAVTQPAAAIAAGRVVTLGFHGARFHDATGLIATDVESGHQWVVGKWARPAELDEQDEWEVDEDDVNWAVGHAFATWDVWRLYGNPQHWETALDRWAGEYGAERVVRWWTHRDKAMAFALKAWKGDMRPGVLSHDGDELLAEHLGNAVRRMTLIRDEPDGDPGPGTPSDDPDDSPATTRGEEITAFLWVIRKESPKSRRAINLAFAACLSWEARGDAIRAGALNKPIHGRASWR